MKRVFCSYDENDPILKAQYQNDNFMIINNANTRKRGGTCYIYFSGNGLYTANNLESFQKSVQEANRYEWMKLRAKGRIDKEIFIRDIYLSWYAKGINSRLDNIEKLIEWLKSETEGFEEIVTIGNSAGGYMAVICGCALRAKRVFSICGQFSLSHHNGHTASNPLLVKYGEEKFYENYRMIEGNPQIPVYYIYSHGVDHDCEQAGYVESINHVRILAVDSARHGKTLNPFDYPVLLSMNQEQLDALFRAFAGRVVAADAISIRMKGNFWIKKNRLLTKIMKLKTKLIPR